ncbi:hypothetical protein AURDEDRAFT_153752 [Auricularia subglabra TFB-10046 SS5]|uniref:F-box domain-containing protein n=1 Tax=Auricularia subglabra (strain TFB-10046 / SS5) TaxID=717982 RepID=J0LJ99_AURST|nr:hypothetical protein AURDEDRAFT_153752 [Auricularia subglabra TFB-10046 SS5]
MSVEAHRAALNASFAGYFGYLSNGITDATMIKQACDEIRYFSDLALSRLILAWDRSHTRVQHLPDEILALCFALLPFRDRVWASHVSCRWRAISLANPTIWTTLDMDVPVKHSAALFNMAIDRTGNCPVDVLNCPVPVDPEEEDPVEAALIDHFHHIRTLCHDNCAIDCFTLEAPLLESIHCGSGTTSFSIFPDFLAGAVGRLKTLRFDCPVDLPTEACPPLTTVISLALYGPRSIYGSRNFNLLFSLFPALQSLSVLVMRRDCARFFPPGPIPASLRYLRLQSSEKNYDLTPHYADWRSDTISHVEISQDAAPAERFVHLVADALIIDVRCERDKTTAITALGPGSRRREIRYGGSADEQPALPASMTRVAHTLSDLHTLRIPATVLDAFVAFFTALPRLAHLEVSISEQVDDLDQLSFPWGSLAPLARLPQLQSLSLSVFCHMPPYLPSAQDARDLLAQLQGTMTPQLPDISIRGFSPAAVAEATMPQMTGGPRIVFGTLDATPGEVMITFDDAALRAQVTADYSAVAHDITDATQMGYVFDTVMDAAISTVRESMNGFNNANPINRMPAEILVACFVGLPFLDRIRASHVCRAWRAAALACPELWSDIAMGYMSKVPELLNMALPRLGADAVSVDLSVHAIDPGEIEAVDAALEPYMLRLRRVSWMAKEESAVWTLPAPRLEILDCFFDLMLTPNFLGGKANRLRSLRVRSCALPTSCAALSTVVDLHIRNMNYSTDTSSFRRLFDFFPRLQSLYLGGLEQRFADDLPTGRAPASLQELRLKAESPSGTYDLTRHYVAWDAHRIATVSLAMADVREADLEPPLRGALVLWIISPNGTGYTRVMSEHTNATFRSVRLSAVFHTRRFAQHAFAARSGLQNVHSVKISHTALESFLPLLTELSALKHVVVHIASTRVLSRAAVGTPRSADNTLGPPPRYKLDWAPLNHLRHLPRLESLTLQVSCTQYREPPPTVADAEALLNVLAVLDARSLPHVQIEGFPHIPGDVRGLRVTFHIAAGVGALPWPHVYYQAHNDRF